MPASVQKWGNSLAIRIPKTIAEQVNVRAGSQVEFDTTDGVLTIRPVRKPRESLSQLLSRARGRSPHRALSAGGPAGRELI